MTMDTTQTKAAMKHESGEVRFIVRSAEEAVQRVRETLGPKAKVTSVRQVKGSGLGRFLSAPRLEIIARVESDEPAAPENVVSENPVDSAVLPDPQPVFTASSEPEESTSPFTCARFLNRAGLPEELLARLDGQSEWRRIGGMGLSEGLPLAVQTLRQCLNRRQPEPLPSSSAFLGGPGSGKTTALCKLLAREVFIEGRRPQVLRLEVDKPHLDDGLVMYCEVLGVTCTRNSQEIDFKGNSPVFVDLPGFSLREQDEQARIADKLDELGIEGRVMVLNAAYEESILRRFTECGRQLKARHQVLTHLDELEAVGKLWSYLFDTERSLLFFSDGQNIAGDRIDDPFGYLLERTFPR